MTPPRKTPVKRSVQTRSTRNKATVSDTASVHSVHSDSDNEGEHRDKIVKTESDDSCTKVHPENQAYLAAFENIRFTKQEYTNATRIIRYPLGYGQIYPSALIKENPGLAEFEKIVSFQGWDAILSQSNQIYPVQIAQFWATVKIDKMVLSANFEAKEVEISMKDFGAAFGVECAGYEVEAWGGWKSANDATKAKFKRFLDPNSNESALVIGANLSPLAKLLFNVMHTVFLPRKKGVNKLHTHEVIAMYNILKSRKIHLPYLIFTEIINKAERLRQPEFVNQGIVPFSMWLSKLLEIKGVIPKNAPTLPPYQAMTLSILKNKVKVLNDDGTLLTADKGKAKVGTGTVEKERVSESFDESVAERLFGRIERLVDAKFAKFEELVLRGSASGAAAALNDDVLRVLGTLSEQLTAVQAELAEAKKEVAFSMCGALYKIKQMKVDVDRLVADNEVMKEHGRELVAGVNRAVKIVRDANVNPTARHNEVLDKIREVRDDTARCRFVLDREFPQV